MPAVISTLKRKGTSQQVVQKMKEAQSEALKLQHVLKSHFPQGVHDSMWTGTADEVGEKHQKFLETWFVVAATATKDEERKAVLKAFPKCPQSYADTLINKSREVRKHVLKKGRNMKSGILMADWCKQLLAVLSGLPGKGTGPQAILPVSENVSAASSKARPGLTQVSGSEKQMVETTPCLEKAEDNTDSELLFFSQASPKSVKTVDSSVASLQVVPLAMAEEPCLEKAKKMKRPAAPVKRPAANTSTASSKATTWQPSDSFGFLKCTKATEKSYIQAKPDLSAKPYCLVNVQGSGVDHAAVVDQLMEYAKQAGLDKAKVVKEKISLLAPEVD